MQYSLPSIKQQNLTLMWHSDYRKKSTEWYKANLSHTKTQTPVSPTARQEEEHGGDAVLWHSAGTTPCPSAVQYFADGLKKPWDTGGKASSEVSQQGVPHWGTQPGEWDHAMVGNETQQIRAPWGPRAEAQPKGTQTGILVGLYLPRGQLATRRLYQRSDGYCCTCLLTCIVRMEYFSNRLALVQ